MHTTLLRWYTKFLCLYVLFVIFAGALVTSHDAGLSVPDWPTTYGENMFLFPVYKWVGGIFYEHGHRLVAFGVGTLTLILAPWTWWAESRAWVRYLSAAALLIVLCQGIVGGLTVRLGLPVLVSTLHAVLAQTFLGVVLILAYAQSFEFKSTTQVAEPASLGALRSVSRYAALFLAVVYAQLIVGAVMRHSGAGLAVLDFPLMAGSLVPSTSEETLATINAAREALQFGGVDAWQVALHLAHRAGACVVVLVGALLLWRIAASAKGLSSKITSLGWAVAGVLLVQFGLGIATVLSVRNPFIASFHVLVGALLLALALLLVLRSRRAV